MTPVEVGLLVALAAPTSGASDYPELYDDDHRDAKEALQMARAAGVFVDPLPATLPRTVAVAPVAIDFGDWQQARPEPLDGEYLAGITEHIGNMLRMRLLREGFEVVETGADAQVQLSLVLDACVVPENRKTRQSEQAGTYPCVSAGSKGSGLKLSFIGDGVETTIQKRPAPMSSGRETVDRAILGANADWMTVLPAHPWQQLDLHGPTGVDVRLALNLGQKVIDQAVAVWADDTRTLREAAGLVRRVDHQHPVPPLPGMQACFVGTVKSVLDGEQHDVGLRLAHHPDEGRIVTDELAIGGGIYRDRQLVQWAVDGDKANGRAHLQLSTQLVMVLQGAPWEWTSWSVAFAHDWSRTYTRTDTGLNIVDDFGERFGTLAYTLERVDEAGCTALFETSPPPRDWPLWEREPAASAPPAPPATAPN